LTIDRRTAMRVGISTQNVVDALYDAFGQRQVSTLFTQLNQYHVILEVLPDFQKSPRHLEDIYIKPPTGAAAPLSVFTRASTSSMPILISHLGQFPATTVSFNLAPGAALGQAVNAIRRVERETPTPPAMQASFQGTAEAFEAPLTNQPLLILAAVITVYI